MRSFDFLCGAFTYSLFMCLHVAVEAIPGQAADVGRSARLRRAGRADKGGALRMDPIARTPYARTHALHSQCRHF
jgi:hypothetical protein